MEEEVKAKDGLNEPGESLADTLRAAMEEDEARQEVEPHREETKPDSEPKISESKKARETPDTIEEPILPPISWATDAKEHFQKLPRDLQQVVVQRAKEQEADYTRKTQEVARLRKHYEEIDSVLDPYKDRLALQGTSAGQVIKQLLVAQDKLNTTPVETLRWLADAYGVTPEQLAGVEGQPKADPYTKEVDQRVQYLENLIRQQQYGQQQKYHQSLVQEVQSFADERDEAGGLKHPYVERLSSEMVGLAQQIKQANPQATPKQVLSEAYERAVWSNPDTRAARLQVEEQRRLREAEAKAAAARKAGSSISGSPGGGLNPDPPDNLRALLMQAFGE